MTIDFMAQAQAMRDELVERRRDLHRHPELAFQEFRTSGIVAEELNKLGLEVQTGIGQTGVIAILEGDKDGPTILVRADMDALPIEEANQMDYISSENGKMHACGHDGHVTIGLGVAKLLSQHRDKIAGRVKFVFQPAEEIGQGANAMIADGALDNPKADVALGLHLWPTEAVGTINMQAGPVMAGAAMFEINITGKGGHGAMPHQTIDPVVCAAQMTMAFQTIISRNANPLDAAVLSVTQLIAGTARNIIPDTAMLTGTIRTYTDEMMQLILERMETIAKHTAAAMNCEAEITIRGNGRAVVNNEDVVSHTRRAFEKVGKTDDDFFYERSMASEDVSAFLNAIPGMFFFLGSGNEDGDKSYALHHPNFDIDEDVLPEGVALLSAAIAEYLIQEE
jgi:amidohydrolase